MSDQSVLRSAITANNHKTVLIENVGVRYRVPNERIATFKEYMIRRLEGKIRHRQFWALRKDIVPWNEAPPVPSPTYRADGRSVVALYSPAS